MLLFYDMNLAICAITYKCGRVVLSRASVYFAISKLALLFSYNRKNNNILSPNTLGGCHSQWSSLRFQIYS